MNPIMKRLWKWQANRKVKGDDMFLVYASATILGKIGGENEIPLLLENLSHSDQSVRNASAQSLRDIINRNTKTDVYITFQDLILEKFEKTDSLRERLAIIEVMAAFTQLIREQILGPMLVDSEDDLQYAIIRSLSETEDKEILGSVLDSSDTKDLILRKIALQTWYNGVNNLDFDENLAYFSDKLHYLIRAVYELQTDGAFLRKVLSYANQNDLPTGKAYPDFMIRYLTELLNSWEYDPDAYRSLHQIVIPSYFTFDDPNENEERPFLIL